MTKEEYLKLYKEDALAEICVSLEKACSEYKEDITKALADKAQKLNELNVALGELQQMKETFHSVDRLFEKLKQLPAEDFLTLHCKMKSLIAYGSETKECGSWTTISNGASITAYRKGE